jgi:hypothetical protein
MKKLQKKYTQQELINIYKNFEESNLSINKFTKKNKIGSKTLYKAKKTFFDNNKHQNLDEKKTDEIIDSKKLNSKVISKNRDELHLQIFKYALILLASQFVFTIVLLYFLN